MPWYRAPAKINLGLRVGRRDARGYHPVDTVMQTVAFEDRLWLAPAPELRWEVSGAAVTEDNLIVRAYRWCRARNPALPPVHGKLEKRIWTGAGLGGGSSDAAAVVRWAYAGDPRLALPDFHREASALGMDVPFFLLGGRARAQGYGERLTPLDVRRRWAVVLANPGFELSTAAVYEAYDALDTAPLEPSLEAAWPALAEGGDLPQEALVNDLEEAAFRVEPRLRAFREVLRAAADGAPFALSGSGPTYYIVGNDPEWAAWMAHRLRDRGIARVYPTTTLERGSL
ncbi:MAG: 4-diphosphocytidyl-2C-methyl-D-erythritol kinase [Firmicutes bacterium]|nr:4-diphosphocytidyl-2C-methyl-D-erythritol kinase [Bacillota bacterium]